MYREEKMIRIAATASMNLELIIDTLTSSILNLREEAKKIGIFKQERKQRINQLVHEVILLQNRLDRRAGEHIEDIANYNEAFSEQIMFEQMNALEECKKVLEESRVPNSTYLAMLHQSRVIGIASYTAIEIWNKHLHIASKGLSCPYTLEYFRPKNVMDRMHQLLVFEFSKFQGRQENSESAKKSDIAFVGKLADTNMVCAIMEGRIKPSWM